jgi:hypothetical protein
LVCEGVDAGGAVVAAGEEATHNEYRLYIPKLPPYFEHDGTRFIFFEATYSQTFLGNDHPMSRYG